MGFRVDFIFSYWIFVWYLLYVTKYIRESPKFALLMSFIQTCSSMILLRTANIFSLFCVSVLTILIKVIPLYSLRNEYIKMDGVIFAVCLFTIYIIWLHINNETMLRYYRRIYDSLNANDDKTPFVYLMRRIFG
jgi:uncharacterized membrane protein